MKYLIKVICLLSLAAPLTSHAEFGSVASYVETTSMACGASYLVSAIFAGQNSVAVGSAVCAGMAVGFAADRVMNDKKISSGDQERILDLVDRRIMASREDTKVLIKDVASRQIDSVDKRFDEVRKVMRDLISERAMAMEDAIGERIKSKMSDPDFIPGLEIKVINRIKEEISSELRSRKRDYIKEVIRSVIDEIDGKIYPINNHREMDRPRDRSNDAGRNSKDISLGQVFKSNAEPEESVQTPQNDRQDSRDSQSDPLPAGN
jgi:hypothetical protein